MVIIHFILNVQKKKLDEKLEPHMQKKGLGEVAAEWLELGS